MTGIIPRTSDGRTTRRGRTADDRSEAASPSAHPPRLWIHSPTEMNEPQTRAPDDAAGATEGAREAPSFRGPGVETESAPGGFLPGVLRFFVVPLLLVGASVAVFAGLGALVNRRPPSAEDLVASIAGGGKNARWQAAQDLSNLVYNREVDLARDERLATAVAEAFRKARADGDDPRVLQLLA